MSMTRRSHKHDPYILSTMEDLVPQDHLVRKLESAIDWSFIYDKVRHLYSSSGRKSIDPVILFKMIAINILFGYNSMRRTCREIQVNIAYRWFLGIPFDEDVPNYSTWSKNYQRRFSDSDIFEEIFARILEEVSKNGFLDLETVYGDSTHQKANANKNRYEKRIVKRAARAYEEELTREINEVRREHGQKPFEEAMDEELCFSEKSGKEVKKKPERYKNTKVSRTDPESGLFHKGEKEKCFAYSHQTACDKNGYVIACATVPGNVHDSVSFFELFEKLKKFGSKIRNVCLDAGYATPAILRELIENGKKPFLPYRRPKTKKGFMKKYEYVYDEGYDCVICPELQILPYSTTTREGYRQYRSDPGECRKCPRLGECTHSKSCRKVVSFSVWERYREISEDIRHGAEWKEIYPKRKQTIERVFAESKEKHNLRFTRLRGLRKNSQWVSLIFAFQNLKKMALHMER